MNLEDKKKQLEFEIFKINQKYLYNQQATIEELSEAQFEMQNIRMKIWKIEKAIKLNKKLKKVMNLSIL